MNALAQSRNTPEASRLPTRLDFKDAGVTAGGLIDVDEVAGIVTAIVSVTGVVDEVDDIILPGAYAETLAKRRPKVVWAHSWDHMIGRVEYIEELLPGDKRLPSKTRDGQPWPSEAGALVAAMKFNLRTDDGRNAFEAVRFYSETGECEYSIGYAVPPGRAAKNAAGTRLIKMLELYELSVVLFGAHTMTGTLSVKSALAALESKASETPDSFVPPKSVQNNAQRGLDLRKSSGKGGTATGVARARDLANGSGIPLATIKRMVSFFARHEVDKAADGWGSNSDPSPGYVAWLLWGGDAGKRWCEGIAKRHGEGKGVDLATLGRKATPPPFVKADDDEVSATPEGEGVQPEAEPETTEETGQQPDHSDGIMVAVFPDPAAADAIANHLAGPDDTTSREELHVTLAYLGKVGSFQTGEQDVYDALVAAVDGSPALVGEIGGIGQFPPGEDGTPTWAPVDAPGLSLLREQVVAVLGDDVFNDHGFTPHMTLGYDIGLIDAVPPTPVTFGQVSLVYGNSRRDINLGAPVGDAAEANGAKSAPTRKGTGVYDPAMERKAEGGADRNRGGAEELRRYWTVGEGGAKIGWGTPGDFTRCVGFLDEHMPGRAEGYCANRHKEVTGMWPGDRDNKGLDTVPLVTPPQARVEHKGYPQMPGSYEERQQALTQAIVTQYKGDVDEHGNPRFWINVHSTWDSQVLYSVTNMRLIGDNSNYYLATYEYADGVVDLGEPQEVDLTITPVAVDGDTGIADTMPLAEDVMGLALTMLTAQHAVTEGKAGRVLSGANERALRTAVQHLLDVFASAGVVFEGANPESARPVGGGNSPAADAAPRQVDPRTDTGTTSSESKALDNGDGTFTIDAKSLEDVLADFA